MRAINQARAVQIHSKEVRRALNSKNASYKYSHLFLVLKPCVNTHKCTHTQCSACAVRHPGRSGGNDHLGAAILSEFSVACRPLHIPGFILLINEGYMLSMQKTRVLWEQEGKTSPLLHLLQEHRPSTTLPWGPHFVCPGEQWQGHLRTEWSFFRILGLC